MWVGLFSDIHANREALEASLDHARGSGISRFIFLGDYVGYGADPGFVVDTLMREVEHGAVAIQGNHDAAHNLVSEASAQACTRRHTFTQSRGGACTGIFSFQQMGRSWQSMG
jgi:predicted phosphodiesterase